MNKIFTNKLLLTAFSLFILIALMSNSSGRANVFGQAVTGAPGDSNNTCASSGCHSSGAFSPNAALSVEDVDGNAANFFVPGETYDVTLSVQASGTPSAYGFQMVALTENDTPVNSWSEIGDNIQLVQLGDRDYLEHDSPSSSNEFKTKWTAPEEGAGNVTFYFSANAVNGNGGTSGDGGTNSNFVLPEVITSSNDLAEESISVFPQPAGDFINITGESLDYYYTIINLQGLRIMNSRFSSETIVDISLLKSGLYFITIQSENKSLTKKLIKR